MRCGAVSARRRLVTTDSFALQFGGMQPIPGFSLSDPRAHDMSRMEICCFGVVASGGGFFFSPEDYASDCCDGKFDHVNISSPSDQQPFLPLLSHFSFPWLMRLIIPIRLHRLSHHLLPSMLVLQFFESWSIPSLEFRNARSALAPSTPNLLWLALDLAFAVESFCYLEQALTTSRVLRSARLSRLSIVFFASLLSLS
jgi:hypothetical protein